MNHDDEVKRQKYLATCPEETKGVLEGELRRLGADEVVPVFKGVRFKASLESAYEIHLRVRSASRIFRILKEATLSDPEHIMKVSASVRWPTLIKPNHTFMIQGAASGRFGSPLPASYLGKMVRHGILRAFKQANCPPPQVDLEEPKVVVVAYWDGERLSLSVDTSGKTLHKRGYRKEGHPAPIKETLAASLLSIAGYDGGEPLFDPMCGSGTIAIEAASMALHKAPLIHRKKGDFGFEWLSDFDASLWRSVQERARNEKLPELAAPIYASDIGGSYVEAARENALQARVERYIQFSQGDFLASSPPCERGLLVANLPYGERLEAAENASGTEGQADIKEFYREVGNTLKRRYSGWRAVFLVGAASPYKFIGLKPTKKIDLLNGAIPCKLLFFDLYEGRKSQTEVPKRPS